MTLLSGENASRRISEGRPGERQGDKGKQGEKERKETGSRKRKPAAEGADAGADARTVRIQKSPEAFLPQGFC